jgi:hypothetical protein
VDIYLDLMLDTLGLAYLAKHNLIQRTDIAAVEMLMILKVEDKNEEVRLHATSCLASVIGLVDNRLIPVEKIRELVSLMISRSDDADSKMRSNSVGGLSSLVESNLIPSENLDNVVLLMINKATNDLDESVKSTAIFCLSNLTKNHLIKADKVSEVINLIIQTVNNNSKIQDEKLRANAIAGIASLAEANLIPAVVVGDVIALLVRETEHSLTTTASTRRSSLFALGQLAKHMVVPADRIQSILPLFVSKCSDSDEEVRLLSFDALFYLTQAQADNSTQSFIVMKDVVDVMMTNATNSDTRIQTKAISILAQLAESSSFPRDRISSVVGLLIKKAHVEDVAAAYSPFGFSFGIDLTSTLSSIIPSFSGALISPPPAINSLPENEMRAKAISGLVSFAENHSIPQDKLIDLVMLINGRQEDLVGNFDKLRSFAVSSIASLVASNQIPFERIANVVTLMISRADDPDDKIRSDAIYVSGLMHMLFLLIYSPDPLFLFVFRAWPS